MAWLPVDRVGLYVPGGRAVYPSSVVMNVVPAQTAGVRSLAVASPPQKDTGRPHPLVLAACALLGVDEVYAVGGAQAIAMFAYGTDESAPVDLVTGPGNIWVTAAKRLLRGIVGTDAEAGPTEIAILADDSADPRHVAADLISQAEHDPLAASVLVTMAPSLVDSVEVELAGQVAATKHTERVRSAGAIFIGPWSPVSLGDYCAGSNHVLPTGGCARHGSGLSVQTFLRGVQVIEYAQDALRDVTPHVVALAEAEDLPAHGQAVTIRFHP